LIENLTKNFGDQIAVNNLKMSIKQGEIFTILGHNGAGKTTAIYMMTGVLSPTSGDASIYGNKISESMTKI
jgi:ABC-type multidrug transport system ATPase subunit